MTKRIVYTVEQRDALRDRVLAIAKNDHRVVAGAAVGSLALGGGDQHSDLDMTFGVADSVHVSEVLDDWTRTLGAEFDAVPLVDLERGAVTYRVFLMRDLLQLDLSMAPAAQFAPAGPRFRLLFGATAEARGNAPQPPDASDLFGWGVIYTLHVRACLARGRIWQAEHYIAAVRDHALSLACLRLGVPAVQARGYDDLPAELLVRFEATRPLELEPSALRRALAAAVRELLREGKEGGIHIANDIGHRLAELQ
jgi:hypothetical protein